MSNSLALVETITAVEFFKPGASASILDQLEAEARSISSTLDVSIPSDREKIRSLAAKLGKAKNRLDNAGKELVAGEKARLKLIDTERGIVWDKVEALQAEVRKPLTDWENAEKDRVAAHEAAIAAIPESLMYGALESSAEVTARLDGLQNAYAARDWQEFSHRAKQTIDAEIVRTQEILKSVQKREAEAAELAKLRAEQAEREQRERDARIAQEAREAVERAAEAERKRIEQDKFQAEARAKEAEARERAAAEKAEQDRLAAIEAEKQRIVKAEADRIAAEERHEREKAEAVEAEKRRQEAESKRLQDEAEARERNKQHAAKINREAAAAIVTALEFAAETVDEPMTYEQYAKAIVIAIAKGQIPHCKVVY